ncbi:MAG TPA: sugar phosphate isomerase/epimerase family protein [Draconibacterium sp.]|nr:sugar phosphate isomerase/epimerase family protein [Draconibacterium sp.]
MNQSKKIKLAITVTSIDALSKAFVVLRGFEESIIKAAELGYDGVELAVKHPDDIKDIDLSRILSQNNMEVSSISTGLVYAQNGYMFTEPDDEKRGKAIKLYKELIDMASDFGQIVNIGLLRGYIGDKDPVETETKFIAVARELCSYAEKKGVTIILEPVNRYEIDFINSVEEGVKLLEKIGFPNLKLMPDVFHMNIEDRTIGGELAKHIKHAGYIHLADSNRLAPGWGHTDFDDIFKHLKMADYKGWLSVEVFPKPTPMEAATQAVRFLKPYFEEYNR